jgi:hypothetical protein
VLLRREAMLDVAFRVTNFQPRGISAVNAKQDARFAFGIGNDQLRVADLRFQFGAFDTLAVLVFRECVWTAIRSAPRFSLQFASHRFG